MQYGEHRSNITTVISHCHRYTRTQPLQYSTVSVTDFVHRTTLLFSCLRWYLMWLHQKYSENVNAKHRGEFVAHLIQCNLYCNLPHLYLALDITKVFGNVT